MLNIDQAEELAVERIRQIGDQSKIQLCILKEETLPFEHGWVFFYQSEEFVRTRDVTKLVGGNAPIIIDKQTGILLLAGTGHDVSYYLVIYNKFKEDWCS